MNNNIEIIKTLKAIIEEELLPQMDDDSSYLGGVESNVKRLENVMKDANILLAGNPIDLSKPSDLPNFQGYDGFEIHPCMIVDDDGCSEIITENDDMVNIVYWTIFGHLETGGVDTLADFKYWHEAQAALMYWSSLTGFNVVSPMRSLGFNTPITADVVVEIKGGALQNVYQCPQGDQKVSVGVDLLDHDIIGELSHEHGKEESEQLADLEKLRDEVQKFNVIW